MFFGHSKSFRSMPEKKQALDTIQPQRCKHWMHNIGLVAQVNGLHDFRQVIQQILLLQQIFKYFYVLLTPHDHYKQCIHFNTNRWSYRNTGGCWIKKQLTKGKKFSFWNHCANRFVLEQTFTRVGWLTWQQHPLYLPQVSGIHNTTQSQTSLKSRDTIARSASTQSNDLQQNRHKIAWSLLRSGAEERLFVARYDRTLRNRLKQRALTETLRLKR